MVSATQEIDVKQVVLDSGTFGPTDIKKIAHIISKDFAQFDGIKEAVNKLEQQENLSPADHVRLGVCQYLVGQFRDAIETLKKGDGGALCHFYLGRAYFVRNMYPMAIESYKKAEKAGYNRDECRLVRAELYRYDNRAEDSLHELDQLSGAIEQTAEYLYQRGATVAMLGENPAEAIALYERAEQVDKYHPGALFGLAQEWERRGYDEKALEFYKRAVTHFPTNVGTLMNLGILYEDMEQYDQAIICYQRVLDSYPNVKRAQLFLKDACASNEMHFDEDAQRKQDRVNQVLNLPVSDFEMSVRSRNCLKSMGVNTLGDLCRHTEQELLNSKNFGETSLVEIREILSLKGLQLGQYATERHFVDAAALDGATMSQEEQAVMLRPVTDMNLSVRARKCMNRLGIATIGELVRLSAEELLGCKNFGVTSLKEIREKLVPFDITLRGE